MERKQRKLSVVSKREQRLSERAKARAKESRSFTGRLKTERAEREKKVRREQERLRKKHEEEMKRAADTEDPTQTAEAREKIEHLHGLTVRSSSHVISLDDAAYKRYVLEGNRPYYVLLTFTALGGSTACAMCHDLQRALQQVASQYSDEHPTAASYAASTPPIFFINVDANRNREVFESMKLNTAPTSVILSPRLSSKPLKQSSLLSSTPSKQRFVLQPRNHPHDVVMFIHKNSGQMIVINYNAVNGEEIVIATLAAACALFVLYRYFEQIVALRRNPQIRFILCIVGWCAYMWCISGGMYNIIKGNIFAHSEKDRATEYISSEPRDQYGAEGLILGFLNIAASSMLVLCNLRAFEGWREGKAGGGAMLRGWLGSVWASVGPLLRPELCIGLVFFFWFYIVSIYSWKNRGYRNGFVSAAQTDTQQTARTSSQLTAHCAGLCCSLYAASWY